MSYQDWICIKCGKIVNTSYDQVGRVLYRNDKCPWCLWVRPEQEPRVEEEQLLRVWKKQINK
jgi:hypothetical protein